MEEEAPQLTPTTVAELTAQAEKRQMDVHRVFPIKFHMARDYSKGSLRDLFGKCGTEEEVQELAAQVTQAMKEGKLRASQETLRKVAKRAAGRIIAMRSSRLYGPDGKPVIS